MDTTTMFDAFDEHALEEHRTKYAEEAQRKWGATDAWAESQRKTSAYTKEDWKRIQQEAGQIDADMAALMDQKATDPEVQDVVRRKHEHLNHNFCTCSVEMLAGLSEMWVSDAPISTTRPPIPSFSLLGLFQTVSPHTCFPKTETSWLHGDLLIADQTHIGSPGNTTTTVTISAGIEY